ncbi:hypothetical protein [Aeromonas sp. 601027]|uniref:hypothetical protein n=1 Tax=Aeromonas sp. 601027 TaxID=2712036 RepID=UPI003BA18900
MYEDINVVLSDIQSHLESKYKTNSLNIINEERFAVFQNENFHFVVDACFIQCRTDSDFLIPIETRINDAIGNLAISQGKKYKLTRDENPSQLPSYVIVEI